jgi:hypothetical protein
LTRHGTEDLWSEIAYLAFHFHWELDTLLDLQHDDRNRLLTEVAALNERAMRAAEEVASGGW